MADHKRSFSPTEAASWCLAAAALLLTLWLHLLPALFAGLLVFELVHVLAPLLQRAFAGPRARLAVVMVLATSIVGMMAAAILGAIAFFRSDAGSLPVLLQKMADIIDSSRNALPPWLAEYAPSDADELREALTEWLRGHAPELRGLGAEAARVLTQIIIGMVIGAMASLRTVHAGAVEKPLARALLDRSARVGDSFRRVVFAQVRISALNTAFTAIYLAVVLPLCGVHLPLTGSLIGVTFVAGLLPIVGNLVSNTVIVIISLAHSPLAALASLGYLVGIHKLEYFFNARIVGTRIHAQAWEVLLAMLVMEAAFGIAGVIAAPVYYAYLKRELTDRGLA